MVVRSMTKLKLTDLTPAFWMFWDGGFVQVQVRQCDSCSVAHGHPGGSARGVQGCASTSNKAGCNPTPRLATWVMATRGVCCSGH